MTSRFASRIFIVATLASSLFACERELDPESFKREAERSYIEAHPGWGIVRREGTVTTFVRGDQVDTLDVGKLFDEYKATKKSGSDYFEEWIKKAEAESKARRRVIDQAKSDVIPIIKSGSWIRVQDLGAIGPKHLLDRIRPWRKDVASDVFILLGIPEENLGFRFASIEEVKGSTDSEQAWIDRAVQNLRAQVRTSTASEITNAQGQLIVYDLSGYDNISGLILDPKFRTEMLEKFGKEELGASAPIRNVLIVFDITDFVTIKPIRARTHQLYDTQNHPGFRGLMRFDRSGISILEPANPEQKKKPVEQ